MDERLLKQWEATTALLAAAAREIESSAFYEEYAEFISYNELELALDVLEDAGARLAVDQDYWQNLIQAAEMMELRGRLAALHQKMDEARDR